MNKRLTEEIAYHVMANLGILPASFVKQENLQSLIDKKFLLPEQFTFQDEDGPVHRHIYGCQISVTDAKEFKMLLADCTQDPNLPEYGLLIQLKDSPAFGVYFLFDRMTDAPWDSEVLIAASPDKKHWVPCSIYLQSTFLAGMEQIRDLGFGWSKCTDYKEQHQQLLSFIDFHSKFYGEDDEGQEN